ncbi:MAG: TetR/AcrR family transcriptional regulator [Mycobacteriaceae bacterium]
MLSGIPNNKAQDTAEQSRPSRSEVRERLLLAAAEEFGQNGYAAARLHQIARQAGFTKGAVYSNFNSKQTLFSELLAEKSAELIETVTSEVQNLNPGAATAKAGKSIATWLTDQAQWSYLSLEFGVQAGRDDAIAQEYRRERRQLRSRLELLISEHAQEWELPTNFDARIVAIQLMATISGLILDHAVDPEEIDHKTIATVIAQVLDSAL